MKHKGLAIAIIAATAAAAIYALTAFYYTSHAMPHSVIAGQEAGGADADGIVDILKAQASSYSLRIEGDVTEDVIYGKDISLTLDDDSARKAALDILSSQKVGAWPLTIFRKSTELRVSPMSASFNEEELEAAVDGLSAVTGEALASQDAAYVLSDGKYEIVNEIYGTEVDRDALLDTLRTALTSLEESIDLRESGDYIDPKIKSDDESLNKLVKSLNKYMEVDITYDLGERGQVTVNKEDQAKWLLVTKKGKVAFDDDAIYSYVQMTLGYKYNTMGLKRRLATSYGTKVTVKGGNYGWWINYAGERDQIKEDLRAGEDVTREPVYHYRAANHGDYRYDYGDSYVEVNIATQHLFLVIGGKKVFDTDVVTGTDTASRRTPTGAYRVTYKTRNATLNGEDYSTPVSCWMPFNGNIGFHDAPWRSRFGGEVYKTSGSHGCVNMPPAMAEKLYGYLETGFPVIVYDQEETEEAREKAETGYKAKG